MKRAGWNMSSKAEFSTAIVEVAAKVMTVGSLPGTVPHRHSSGDEEDVEPDIVVIADNTSAEAVSVGQVIAGLLSQMKQGDVIQLSCEDGDMKPSWRPKYVVTSLTQGALASKSFALALTAAKRCWRESQVIPVQSNEFSLKTYLEANYVKLAAAT